MATTKEPKTVEKNEVPVDPMLHKVTIFLPRAQKNEENFELVSLNGKTYKIMKGVQVQVPLAVYYILAESERMKDRQLRYDEAVSAR